MADKEPTVEYATVRDAISDNNMDELHIECRMSDGQKGAFIVVDSDFPELAQRIAAWLNTSK